MAKTEYEIKDAHIRVFYASSQAEVLLRILRWYLETSEAGPGCSPTLLAITFFHSDDEEGPDPIGANVVYED